jgi:hypothetical protein
MKGIMRKLEIRVFPFQVHGLCPEGLIKLDAGN